MPKYNFFQQRIIDKAKKAKTPDEVKKFLEEFLSKELGRGFDFFSHVTSKLDKSFLEVAIRSKSDLFRHTDRFDREFEYLLDLYTGMQPVKVSNMVIIKATLLFFSGSAVAKNFLSTARGLGRGEIEDIVIRMTRSSRDGRSIDELFAIIPELKSLRSLDLSSFPRVDYNASKQIFVELKDSLESLGLPEWELTDESYGELISLIRQMPNLKHVNIGSISGVNPVKIIKDLVSAGVVSIDVGSAVVDRAIFDCTEIAQNIEEFHSRRPAILRDIASIAENFNQAPKLHTLDLSYCSIFEEDFTGLIKILSNTVPDSSLKNLILESNYIVRPDDLEALAEIQLKTNLLRGNGEALPEDSDLALKITLKRNAPLPPLSEERVARIRGEVVAILAARVPSPSVASSSDQANSVTIRYPNGDLETNI